MDLKQSAAKMPLAQVKKLVDLIDYQAGSVVSRTIIEKKAGNVTLFAFDEGQGLTEHTTPFDAFVQVLDGKVEIVIGGKAVQACAGQIVLMPANIPHALKALEPFKMLLTMLRSGSTT